MQSHIILDAVVGSLLRHEAHGVVAAGGGELDNRGPLVSLGIIEQHFCQIAATILAPCIDESLIV